ncbi:oxidoreductase [Mycobacteroides abscessus]|uniref:oxidoreductase n=1 Tax=Mycobacteroides abscessus TaxID=36809 RepID=UPI000C25A00C|nr:oxidoreductase [Mycobacteroides abscessus]
MTRNALAGGTFTLAKGLVVTRMGYGTMQLAGPGAFGPPTDRADSIALLRNAIECGITHIDTADFYGPHVTNEIIKEALHPYPASLHIATKVGVLRDGAGNWAAALAPDQVRQAVHDNLGRLGLDVLDLVNLRVGSATATSADSITDPFTVLVDLQQQGLIKHLGLSNASPAQISEAQSIAPIVCVQNLYNLTRRDDDGLIDSLAARDIAYVPYFPLGGFTALHSKTLEYVAVQCESTPSAVALAWLLQRSPNILLIPGTSSTAHLHENLSAGELTLPERALAELNEIAGRANMVSTKTTAT